MKQLGRLLSAASLAIVCLSVASASPTALRSTVPLAGTWRFGLDKADAGVRERWFARDLADSIHLPGSLQEQGFGEPPSLESQWNVNETSLKTFTTDPRYAPYRTKENFKSPFWLTPKRHYVGPAWYQRDIEIPSEWRGKHVVLHLERPHWQTKVWLDETELGGLTSLGTPHEFDLSSVAKPGRHRLTIRVDNRLNIPVGPHAHSVTDFSQTNWNGIVGDLSLRATDAVWIDDLEVYPNVSRRSIRVVAELGNRSGQSGRGTVTAVVEPASSSATGTGWVAHTYPATWDAVGGRAEFEYPLGPDAALWDEFNPALYRVRVELTNERGAARDTATATFGLREIAPVGRRMVLNGRPLLLRGTLECAIFPLTGYPPTDVEPWRRILRIVRDYGLNHLRFHTWCPPEAAFQAADELGIYFQVETSCWGRFGDGGPLDTWMPAEGERMLRAYGNHPSFLLFAATNEPRGAKSADFLGKVIETWKSQDRRRLYTSGSGVNVINTPPSDYYIEYATRFHVGMDGGELRQPPQTTADYREFIQKQSVPCIAHELGQWCVYPDFREIPKFNGFLRAGHLEIFRDTLEQSGLLPQAHTFVVASGRLQVELYKAEIEEVLRTPEMGGYQLLDLHDFPGQGIAPVGVLDEFWDSKGYVTPEEYRRFTGPTVPLARLARRVFAANERTEIGVEVSHFGAHDLANAVVEWRVVQPNGAIIREGRFDGRKLPTGELTRIGSIPLTFDGWPTPGQYRLEAALQGTAVRNAWSFWVYPAAVDTAAPANLTIAPRLDAETARKLESGATVLLLPRQDEIAGGTHASFAPVFWNRILFPRQRIHTLGFVCSPGHPALASFPTADHSDWQWADLLEHGRPMILDGLPRDLQPIVQPIDDWNTGRKLGLIFEARVGRGRLLVSSIDLDTDLEHRVTARQLRASLLRYMVSPQFAPKVELTTAQVDSLFASAATNGPKADAPAIQDSAAPPPADAPKRVR